MTAPLCEAIGCQELASTTREVVERDGSRTLVAYCAADAIAFDQALEQVRAWQDVEGQPYGGTEK